MFALEGRKLNSEDVNKIFLLKLKIILYIAIKLRRFICNTRKNYIVITLLLLTGKVEYV